MLTITIESATEKVEFEDVVNATATNIHWKNNGESDFTLHFSNGESFDIPAGFKIVDIDCAEFQTYKQSKIASWSNAIVAMLLKGNSPQAIFNLFTDQIGIFHSFVSTVMTTESAEDPSLFGTELPKPLREPIATMIQAEKVEQISMVERMLKKAYSGLGEKMAKMAMAKNADLVTLEDESLRIVYYRNGVKFTVRPVEFFS